MVRRISALFMTVGVVSAAMMGITPATAQAATTGLMSEATPEDLALAVAQTLYPSGSSEAIVAPSSPASVALQAASFAAAKDVPLVLTSSSTSSTAAELALNALNADDVWLFGAEASFSAGFVADVDADHSLLGQIVDDSPLIRADEATDAACRARVNVQF